MQTATRHDYDVGLVWEGNQGPGTRDYASYGREFRIVVRDKPDLIGSADPAFRGEPRLHNPEELLLAAVASCHMLFYLSLCARGGITVTRYSDTASGRLAVLASGGGNFEEVLLRPRVTISRESDRAAAALLHTRANALCFIANSCKFPIRHEAEIRIQGLNTAAEEAG